MIIKGISCGKTREVVDAAADQGFEIKLSKNNHLQFIPPDKTKPIVTSSVTPGDVRSVRNLISQLRRSGFIWPAPKQEKKM